jgi:DNA replication and repair protein RecF
MELQRLHLLNFRNHESLTLDFCSGVNGITGPNGAGKTSILDAVHYLANCKSYFNGIDAPLLRHDAAFFTLRGIFLLGDAQEEIVIHVPTQGKKTIKRNGKTYDRVMDHIGLLQTVMIAPNDVELVWGGSEDRRRFIDLTISQTHRPYLEALVQYKHGLEQRNALLKALKGKPADPILFEAIEHHLVQAGQKIHERRRAFFEEFQPYFQFAYARISGAQELAALQYQSDLEVHDLQRLLDANRHKDAILERTTKGTHRDDVLFTLNGHPLKRYGSQGQVKSFVLALKAAQYQYFLHQKGQRPVLLLDDVYEKIDEDRAQALMDLVSSGDFGQIIISDTHADRVEKHLSKTQVETQFYALNRSGSLLT